MATKEHTGIRKLAQKVVYAVAVVHGRQMLSAEELRAAEAQLNRAMGPILEAADCVANWTDDLHMSNHTKLRTALEKFNQGE